MAAPDASGRARFAGAAEELNSEVEGLCNISVEDSDAGADGTVGIVTLNDASVFDEDCASAEDLEGIGDDACYLEDFTAATVLVGDRGFRVEGNFAGADDEDALRDGVIEVAEAVAKGFDGQDRFDPR